MYYEIAFYVISVFSFGIPCLLVKWWPSLRCRWLMDSCSFADSEYILAENPFNQIEILKVHEYSHEKFGKVPVNFS